MERGKPLIVQSDRTIFLEVDHPAFLEARDRLLAFAELEKSPEHIHIYRITPISLWNAASAGLPASEVTTFLEEFGKFPLPANVRKEIQESIGRFGLLRLAGSAGGGLELRSTSRELLVEVTALKHLHEFLDGGVDSGSDGYRVRVRSESRGQLKLALARIGYPVEDLAGYREGEPLGFSLGDELPNGSPFALREYQRRAVDAFHAGGSVQGGNGVIVLPCGAGKTIVALGVLEKVGCHALVLSTNITALRQWRRELLEKTTVPPELIGEYSGEVKEVRPLTLSTYQMLTYRRSRLEGFTHFERLASNPWGIIVYDEVHLLPAPVFRFAAEIQSVRRLGLTATLIREDGREAEVFSLIGPKKYDLPWRSLEEDGWIANATCIEVRVEIDDSRKERYLVADKREKFRIASENPRKRSLVRSLVEKHRGDLVLVIGQYLQQLEQVSHDLGAPLITGKTASKRREELFRSFRCGEIPVLVVSKVANFAVDLPDANVAVQISGTFGSRQEEAQRLGRILRPKQGGGGALFYSLVTRGSREQEFAEKRQLFLTEQGYRYDIHDASRYEDGAGGYRVVQCS